MMLTFFSDKTHSEQCIPIVSIVKEAFPTWLKTRKKSLTSKLLSKKFKANSGEIFFSFDENGHLEEVILGMDDKNDFWTFAALPSKLPEGDYYLKPTLNEKIFELAHIAWGLGNYQFDRYKKYPELNAKLFLPSSLDSARLLSLLEASFWVRDLINTPLQDMRPTDLADEATKLAKQHNAKITHIVGEKLLEAGYPSIHTVGRGSACEPRLIDLRWGNTKHPKLTLVGKGVCFDSGGYDLKPSPHMLLMKKDMGGAAHALGLARLIMTAKLPICLRILIPAVENLVSSNAFVPGDIITTRKNISVEVNNTDAEGRLILLDALTEACEEKPDLLIDFATLTGAAKIALGSDIPALFANRDELAHGLLEHAEKEHEFMWRLPLHQPYRDFLKSHIADISNSAESARGAGGAITAALFLETFVNSDTPWVHIDLSAYNNQSRAGRPKGGEMMGLRAIFSYIEQHFTASL